MLKPEAQDFLTKMNLDQFICFVYLYCANTDTQITKAELSLAKSTVEEPDFAKIKSAFEVLGDQERLDVILDHKEFYNTPESKKSLLAEMQKMFEIDNQFHPIEHAVHRIIARIL